MKKKLNKNSGFTLFELLLVIGIFIIIASVSIPVYGQWISSVQMEAAEAEITQALCLARTRSIAGYNNSAHGVYFEVNQDLSDKFILYQGNAYADREEDYDMETVLSASLILSTNLAGNEINFSKGLSMPTATGTVIVSGETEQDFRQININSLGLIH